MNYIFTMMVTSTYSNGGEPLISKQETIDRSTEYSVLLVENKPAMAGMLGKAIHSASGGCRLSLTKVETFEDAVSRLDAMPFDAVLLDLDFTDSRELATIESANKKMQGIPIIILASIEGGIAAVPFERNSIYDCLLGGSAGETSIVRSIISAIERKKAEDARAAAMRTQAMILDSTHLFVAFMDTGFNFIRVSKAFAEANGHEADFFTGKNYFDVHPDEKTKKKYLHVLNTGLPYYKRSMPLRISKGAGTCVKYWDLSIVPTKDASNAVNGIVLSLVDVTAQKATEERLLRIREYLEKKVRVRNSELQRANNRLKLEIAERNKVEAALSARRQILESIYAIETTFFDSLESVCDQIALLLSNILNVSTVMVGYVEKGTFKNITELIGGNSSRRRMVPTAAHPCDIVIQKKSVFQFSGDCAVLFPKNFFPCQTIQYVSYAGVPIFSKTGAITGAICVMDTQTRTFSPDDLRSIEFFARYLGHEIEREIMEERLRASKELHLLGSMASGVAHEVRNPLNGILAISEALFQRLGDNQEYLPYLELIRKQVNRLSELMKDLLDFGKPLADSELPPQPVAEILRSVIDDFSLCSRYKHRPIETRIGTAVYVIKANATKLQQMFFNLLENACEHTPERGRIFLSLAEPETAFVVVRIIDEGAGISAEYLDKVFEPFFTMRKGGTGLGLSIVKRIAEMHGGSIVLYNNAPPPGLTAEVRLPLYQEADRA